VNCVVPRKTPSFVVTVTGTVPGTSPATKESFGRYVTELRAAYPISRRTIVADPDGEGRKERVDGR